MEQLNRLTRSLRRARTVELPEGEAPRERALDFAGGGGGWWAVGVRGGAALVGGDPAAGWSSVPAEMPAGSGRAPGEGAVRAGDRLGLRTPVFT